MAIFDIKADGLLGRERTFDQANRPTLARGKTKPTLVVVRFSPTVKYSEFVSTGTTVGVHPSHASVS